MSDSKSRVDALADLLLNKEAAKEESEPELTPEQKRIQELEERLARLEKSPGAIPTGNNDYDNLPTKLDEDKAINDIYEAILQDLREKTKPEPLTDFQAFIFSSKLAGHTNEQIKKGIKNFRYD